MKANGDGSKFSLGCFPFLEQFSKIESYQLYLKYHPHEYLNRKLIENWSQIDANGLGQIEIKFETKGP